MLEWLHSNGCPISWTAAARAAEEGHLEVLQWLFSQRIGNINFTFTKAAAGGHQAIIQWLFDQKCPIDFARASAEAAKTGQLEALKWMENLGGKLDVRICDEAAASGHIELVKWAHSKGYTIDSGVCAIAAANGHLELLQWVHYSLNCPWGEVTFLPEPGSEDLSRLTVLIESGRFEWCSGRWPP